MAICKTNEGFVKRYIKVFKEVMLELKETYGIESTYDIGSMDIDITLYLGYKSHCMVIEDYNLINTFKDGVDLLNGFLKELRRVWELPDDPYRMFEERVYKEFNLNMASDYWRDKVKVDVTGNEVRVTLTPTITNLLTPTLESMIRKNELEERVFKCTVSDKITFLNADELGYRMAHKMIDDYYEELYKDAYEDL